MEPDRRIRRIAIVGGGAAGWTAAAVLNRKFAGHCSVHVVDTPEPLSAGHAEATLPAVLELIRYLGLDQNDFVDKTQATYRFGTRFVDWSAQGESFWHAFGGVGALIERRPFYHFWHKARAQGLKPKLELFSQEASLAQAKRFIFPANTMGVAPNLRFGLHLDAAMYARHLRTVAERGGVIRLERKVVSATHREDGGIDELKFEDGGSLRADLYLDCTGARAQLLGEFLGVGWQSWAHWLPCDRMLSAPGPLTDVRPPYVHATARAAGWQWRTPLQQVFSHGFVYSAAHLDEESARGELAAAIGGEPLADPRLRVFEAGRRETFWRGNVVAVGEAGAVLDPIASVDLHLVSNTLFNLLDHFPDRQFDPANVASYNASTGDDLESIRDFIIPHYSLSRRDDSPFWRACAALPLPESLAQRIAMYRATGRVVMRRPELFGDLDWFWLFEGMGIVPADYDPLVDTVDFEQVKRLMLAISQKITADTAASPSHDSFFAQANARLAGARKAVAAAQSAS